MKNKYVKFRLAEPEYFALATSAKNAEMSLSEFVRYRLGYPSKRDYRMLLFHISRIGNNLNQLAKSMNILCLSGSIPVNDLNRAFSRLLAIQAELENLRLEFKAGELKNAD